MLRRTLRFIKRQITGSKPGPEIFINKSFRVVCGSPEFETYPELLDKYDNLHKEITFIQVGAYDGRTDTLGKFLRRPGWRGLMIEPNPEAFPKLEARFAEWPEIHCVQCAVAPEEGERDFFYVPEAKETKSWSTLISTLVPERGRIGEFSEISTEVRVAGRRLDSLVAEFGFEHLDILSIDAEGYDFEVMRSLDFDRLKPQIIHYEERHIPKVQREACEQFLCEQGYTVFNEPHPHDTTAYLSEALTVGVS